MKFKAGEKVVILQKGSNKIITEMLISEDCCHKILYRKIFFLLGYDKTEIDIKRGF
jgi:hypothetical protein